MLVKGIADHGWYSSNPSLGAPFGQQLVDYPQGADSLNLLQIRVLALFSSNPGVLINLFFLGTFGLCAFTAHLVLRVLGISALSSGPCTILFSLLAAYHFFRGESHLFLSAYYAVPLTAYLFLRVLGGGSAVCSQALRMGGHRIRRVGVGPDAADAGDLRRDRLGQPLLRDVRGRDARGGHRRSGQRGPTRVRGTQGLLVASDRRCDRRHEPRSQPRLPGPGTAPTSRSKGRWPGNESSDEAFGLRLSNLLLPAPGARDRGAAKRRPKNMTVRSRPATARPATRASARSATSASSG